MALEGRDRGRLAVAIGEFWHGGAGPTHDSLTKIFDIYGIYCPNDGITNKKDRVIAAIRLADAEVLPEVIEDLFSLLSADGVFDPSSEWFAGAARISALNKALVAYRIEVSKDGELMQRRDMPFGHDRLRDVPAARQHIERMENAARSQDTPAKIGSSKELLESICKFVLSELGVTEPDKFPGLVDVTLSSLGLHAKGLNGQPSPEAQSLRAVLGGLEKIATGINALRRDFGTGHGGATPREGLDERHGDLVVAASICVARFILDTFADPRAPWRTLGADSSTDLENVPLRW